ncbi:TetR/AcrR family transcriptional regulator [bacterium]|nr:TetR/AcrR family transcriptional regulator [bacterium]
MGRRARFLREDFINAALQILSQQGLSGVTIAAIASSLNAPVGSVYHRFVSRELILAEVWLKVVESFQKGFLEILIPGEELKAALYTLNWSRLHPNRARVLLLHRREELMVGDWPMEVKEKAELLKEELDDGLKQYTKKVFGEVTPESFSRVLFALVEVPAAAVRRHLQMGSKIPVIYDELVGESCNAVLERFISR